MKKIRLYIIIEIFISTFNYIKKTNQELDIFLYLIVASDFSH